MIKFIKSLFVSKPAVDEVFDYQLPTEFTGYGTSFTGPLPTWAESELEIVSFQSFPEEAPEDTSDRAWMEHNPHEYGFPEIAGRFRFPDRRLNDILIYSESSQSYAVIQHRALPSETANVITKMRDGFTYAEAVRAN
jgi:hypothetical protein